MPAPTQVDTHGLSDAARDGTILCQVPAPVDAQPHYVYLHAPFDFDIIKLWTKMEAGSCTFQLLINGLAVEMGPAEGGADVSDIPSEEGVRQEWVPAESGTVISVDEGDVVTFVTDDVASDSSDLVIQLYPRRRGIVSGA